MFRHFDERLHNVRNVSKTSCLTAVPINRDVLFHERLLDEIGNNHPVSPGLARTNRVKQTNNDCRDSFLFPVSYREKLIDRLRARVTPTALVCRTQNQIVIFSERYPLTLAVYLRGGRDQHSLALLSS